MHIFALPLYSLSCSGLHLHPVPVLVVPSCCRDTEAGSCSAAVSSACFECDQSQYQISIGCQWLSVLWLGVTTIQPGHDSAVFSVAELVVRRLTTFSPFTISHWGRFSMDPSLTVTATGVCILLCLVCAAYAVPWTVAMREARAIRRFNRLWQARVLLEVVAALWLVRAFLDSLFRCTREPYHSRKTHLDPAILCSLLQPRLHQREQ